MVIGIFLVVVVAGLALYLATVSTTSQTSSAADVNAAKAYQAARAGAEWAAYWITPAPPVKASGFKTQCDDPGAAPAYTAVRTLTLGDFTVTVTCKSAAAFTEGSATVKWYSIVSNACNAPAAGACPNNATTSSVYVDREVSLTLTN
jgi:MSHA biogenesis protein MshP